MISLTWGFKANHPCPICLVKRKNILTNMSVPSRLRTSADMQKIIDSTVNMTKKRKEATLRVAGLRDVQVCCYHSCSNKFLNMLETVIVNKI